MSCIPLNPFSTKHTHHPPHSLIKEQAGLWVATATLTRGDSSSALGATTSSAVETAERVRQARTEARFAVLGGGGEMTEGRGETRRERAGGVDSWGVNEEA